MRLSNGFHQQRDPNVMNFLKSQTAAFWRPIWEQVWPHGMVGSMSVRNKCPSTTTFDSVATETRQSNFACVWYYIDSDLTTKKHTHWLLSSKTVGSRGSMLCLYSFNTWKLYLFLEYQYQAVSSFLLTAAILVYPYLQLNVNQSLHCSCQSLHCSWQRFWFCY